MQFIMVRDGAAREAGSHAKHPIQWDRDATNASASALIYIMVIEMSIWAGAADV
jgi:hypothetical protein